MNGTIYLALAVGPSLHNHWQPVPWFGKKNRNKGLRFGISEKNGQPKNLRMSFGFQKESF